MTSRRPSGRGGRQFGQLTPHGYKELWGAVWVCRIALGTMVVKDRVGDVVTMWIG